ncbi:hypothetical protein SCHPADRAFT_565396 [Schizopora paradoxa]|uniref:Uncharacterized protein n=1 Tax=Schizopora paradoxa TaxID=27342 RepID=A0A0H2RJ67_9AGAM|nr:hypothetical protein SCHPADRAFT_565396 [Schizopora paradoxa]
MSPSNNTNTNSTSSKLSAASFFRFGFRNRSKKQSSQQQQQQATIPMLAPAPFPTQAFAAAPLAPPRRKPSLRVRTQSVAAPPSSSRQSANVRAPPRSGWFSDGDDYDNDDDEEDEEDATDAIDDFFGVRRSRAERRIVREGSAPLLPKTPKAKVSKAASKASFSPSPASSISASASSRGSSRGSSVTTSPASSLMLASPRSSTSSRTSSSIHLDRDDGCSNAIDDFFGGAPHRRSHVSSHHRNSRMALPGARREYQVSAATASMLSPGAMSYDRRFSSSFVIAKPTYK